MQLIRVQEVKTQQASQNSDRWLPGKSRMSRRVRDRSLKGEMRAAVQGDRERAEARRKAEEEGEYTGPAPPTLDLNKPTREWKLPAKPAAKEAEVPQPEIVPD